MYKYVFTTLIISLLLILVWFKRESAKNELLHNVQALPQKTHLTLGVHPYLSHKSLKKKFTPLTEYLSRKLNTPVKLKITSSYEDQVRLMGENKLDMAYMGPSNYVKMVQDYGIKPLLASMAINGIPYFHGFIIVKKDSPISSVKDLVGKSFAFAKPLSTMGYIIPKNILERNYVTLADLKNYHHLKNHEDIVAAVTNGAYDAGAVKEAVFKNFRSQSIRELIRSAPIAAHVFTASSLLDAKLTKKLKTILINAHDDIDGKEALNFINPNCKELVYADDINFNSLRDYMGLMPVYNKPGTKQLSNSSKVPSHGHH